MILDEIDNCLLLWGVISKEGLRRIRNDQLVLVPENRPFLIGLRHNVPLLKKEQIRFVYATDNMLGLLFYKGKISKTLLFYRELKDDGIVAISGSLYVCLLSKLHGIPVDILAQGTLEHDFPDRDASSVGGKLLISGDDKEKYVIKADDELLEWEIFK